MTRTPVSRHLTEGEKSYNRPGGKNYPCWSCHHAIAHPNIAAMPHPEPQKPPCLASKECVPNTIGSTPAPSRGESHTPRTRSLGQEAQPRHAQGPQPQLLQGMQAWYHPVLRPHQVVQRRATQPHPHRFPGRPGRGPGGGDRCRTSICVVFAPLGLGCLTCTPPPLHLPFNPCAPKPPLSSHLK